MKQPSEKEKKITNRIGKFYGKWAYLFMPFLFLFTTPLFFEFIFHQFYSVAFFKDKVIYCFIYAVILSGFVGIWRKPRTRKISLYLIMSLLTIIYLVEATHYRAFRSVALMSALLRLGDLAEAADSIWEFINLDILFFFMPLLILIFFELQTKNIQRAVFPKIAWKQGIIVVGVGCVLLNGMNYKKIYIDGDVNKQRFRNSTLYLKKYGLMDTLVKEIVTTNNGKDAQYTQDEIQQIEQNFKYTPDKNEYTNRFKGKNLVFIEAESLAPYAIDPILTPSLYKLQQEGLNFTEYHSARINTFNSEYAILNSFYLTPEKEREEFTSDGTMPTLFNQAGYRSTFYHDYLSTFYSRNLRTIELGFEEFYGAKELDITVEVGSNFPSDEALFKNSFDHYAQGDNPFFAYHVTVSPHAGYDEEKRPNIAENIVKVREVHPEYTQEAQVYMAAAMQTDKGVEQLFADLEKQNLLEDTVIALVGDHYPYALRDNIQKSFGVVDSLAQYKVPFIIWDSSKPSKDIPYLATNVDILPTLANMFDLDLKYAMGQDVFSENRKDVVVDWHGDRSYSYLTPEIGLDGDLELSYGDNNAKKLTEKQEYSYRREEWNNSEYVRKELQR